MTHRDRLLAALDHGQPDRVPLDLGSTIASTINHKAYARLRDYLGLPPEPSPRILAERSGSVMPAEDMLERFDVDARMVLLGGPDGRPERRLSPDAFLDEWGVTWTRPAGGHYISTEGPFYRLEDPGPAHLDRFDWPEPDDPGRYRGLRERARELREQTDCAVVLSCGVGPIHVAQFMRGFGEWLEDLLANPAFAEGLLVRITDFWVRVFDRALAETGKYADLIVIGDDLAGQRGPLFRPELYRRLIKPHHARLAAVVKRHGKPLLWHSCGSVYSLIPDLIDIGVNALNPVQVSAANMDTARLKREFGRELAFWGGVDTGRVLPLGTTDEVRAEVKRRIEDLNGDGGYVLCAVHNIQADVPPENVVAMYDAAREIR